MGREKKKNDAPVVDAPSPEASSEVSAEDALLPLASEGLASSGAPEFSMSEKDVAGFRASNAPFLFTTAIEAVADGTETVLDTTAPVDAPSPEERCPTCTRERPCSLVCWTQCGMPAEDFDGFIAELDARTKERKRSEFLAATPRAFKVWAHGMLLHNGQRFEPGDTVTMHPFEAADLGNVLEPVEE